MTELTTAAELMHVHVGQSEGGTLVLLHMGGKDGTGSLLTPDEAREIAAGLDDAADAVEADIGSV